MRKEKSRSRKPVSPNTRCQQFEKTFSPPDPVQAIRNNKRKGAERAGPLGKPGGPTLYVENTLLRKTLARDGGCSGLLAHHARPVAGAVQHADPVSGVEGVVNGLDYADGAAVIQADFKLVRLFRAQGFFA